MAAVMSDVVSSHESQHPYADKWKQPNGERPELVVYNTFTRTKVLFIWCWSADWV